MTDLNNYNLQGFDQTQFQGDNNLLQQTAGLAGPTDENGFFGATTTTNDIFGQTIKTDTDGAADFFGATQTLQGTTTDTNALFGATNTLETVNGTNTYLGNTNTFGGTTIDTNTYFPTTEGVTTTDPNNFFGTTQTLPGTAETNAFFSNPTMAQTQFLPGTTTQTTTTTTTTNTAYGTTDAQIGQTNYNVPTTTSHYLATGANQITYDNYGVPMASVGYGTTAADLPVTTQAKIETPPPQTFNIPTTTTQTTTQTKFDTIPTTTQTTYTAPVPQPVQQVQTVQTTQVQTIPQTIQVAPTPVTIPNTIPLQQQIIQTTQPQIIQPQFGARIMDEDFRRGRPVYNDTRTIGLRLQRPVNNSPAKLRYNIYPNNYLVNNAYGNTGIGLNRVGVNGQRFNNVGLDRLGRGYSYDVYGRGINPLLNRVGLGQNNANKVQTTSNIKDFI